MAHVHIGGVFKLYDTHTSWGGIARVVKFYHRTQMHSQDLNSRSLVKLRDTSSISHIYSMVMIFILFIPQKHYTFISFEMLRISYLFKKEKNIIPYLKSYPIIYPTLSNCTNRINLFGSYEECFFFLLLLNTLVVIQ